MAQTSFLALASALLARAAAQRGYPVPATVNPEPTIGILSMPLASTETPCINAARHLGVLHAEEQEAVSCITAFYPKWIEAGGARAAIIPYNADPVLLDTLLDGVNGVLFTGGNLEDLSLDTPYMQAAGYIYNRTLQKNKEGTFFPLHGTCQGMQVLSVLAARDPSVVVLNAFDSENMSLPLDWAAGMPGASRIFGSAPDFVLDEFSYNVTENLHHDGVPPSAYFNSASLMNAFAIVSTNVDRRGNEFLSTLEARDAPITATQWHPERPPFEHAPGIGLNHTYGSTMAMLWLANAFVENARRNNQTFANESVAERYSVYGLINNQTNGAHLLSGYQAFVFTY